ncbi:MAG: ferritin-like domain-containing protein [Mycobacteriales bacterium]
MSRRDAEAALQAWLAGEHAAIYGYGVVGGRLPRPLRAAVVTARDAHRARRDGLQGLLAARGVDPVAAAPAYDLPQPARTPAEALRLAAGIEERLARASYAVVAAADTGDLRRLAAGALQEQAVRASGWRSAAGTSPATTAFPGRP